jgi:hypothetical protein
VLRLEKCISSDLASSKVTPSEVPQSG